VSIGCVVFGGVWGVLGKLEVGDVLGSECLIHFAKNMREMYLYSFDVLESAKQVWYTVCCRCGMRR